MVKVPRLAAPDRQPTTRTRHGAQRDLDGNLRTQPAMVAAIPARVHQLTAPVATRRGMTETKHEKAIRYLAEGRLVIRSLDEYGGTVQADCRGAGAIHHLGYAGRGWYCSCPARTTCAHILALQHIVAIEPRIEAAA